MRTPQHLLRFLADGDNFFRVAIKRDDGRLVQHDAFAFLVNQRVGGAEVNGKVCGK
jgi:hypothetical protein